MKALTLHQPWASLISLGVKSIETRSWSTKYRGELVIHAGLHIPDTFYAEDGPCGEIYGGPDHDPELLWQWFPEPPDNGGGWTLGDIQGNDSHDMPLGAIVASCKLVDCVPILTPEEADDARPRGNYFTAGTRLLYWSGAEVNRHAYTGSVESGIGQRPYGDFTPGRYAWLLEDIKPVEQRCPACWGGTQWHGTLLDPPTNLGYPVKWDECPTCNGKGTCDPIPAKGKQGLWNWEVAS